MPGVDGALVTFKLLPRNKRRQVPGERGFISMVRLWDSRCNGVGAIQAGTAAELWLTTLIE